MPDKAAAGAPADTASPVFEMLDRLGVDVDVGVVLRYSDGVERVASLDHREHDGMSAVSALLIENGYTVQSPHRMVLGSQVRLRAWPGIWRRFQRDFRDRQVKWRQFTPIEGRLPALSPDDANFAWIHWDDVTTKELLAACAARRVSVNALALWALLQAVRPLVDPSETSFPFILPVDLRRRGAPEGVGAVATSGVMLDLAASDTPESVEAQMRRKVKEKTYLAYWWITEKLPSKLPKSILWRVLRAKELGGNRCMGGCTYLGDIDAWVAKPPSGRRIERAIPYNLLSRQFPVQGVGLLWDGRLTFSLRIHPSVCADVAPFVDAWQAAVEREVGV